ncbi:MAG TPA: HAMP domain-containing histidine kinase, partial [Rhodospirillaceae bacterium]|nr:HAMP domain-containing histidine kinase [Rhodospirillaceae bacterium]
EMEKKSKELQDATDELKKTNEKLQELNYLKDEFIATVTHELRTPLTSIRSFSEILLDNPEIDSGRRDDFLAIIVKESERLSRLINQVLDLAKLEDGTVSWDIHDIDLGAALDHAAASVRQVYLDRKVDLVVDLPPREVRQATDRDRLVQVVINLLSNAVKFSAPETGVVRLTMSADEWGATVSVADNGPGIPAAEQERIFEKFQQGGDTLTSKPAGTGLGLAISRTIVNGLGGWIWVDSTPGEGATFSFFLPMRQ